MTILKARTPTWADYLGVSRNLEVFQMELSINPSQILKLLSNKKTKEKEAVFDYLDSIAEEARELVEIWESIVRNASANKARWIYVDFPSIRTSIDLDPLDDPDFTTSNSAMYSRLALYYWHVTPALRGRIKEHWQNSFMLQLSVLIEPRNLTKEAYEKFISGIRDPFFFDKRNSIDDLKEFSQSVLALQREAAALEVLAKTIRAAGGK